MAAPPRIIPIPCPFGAGSTVYVYYIDAPQPALIDTGVATSPAGIIEPALRAVGLHLEDVRWILATHGHWDHIGGLHAARAETGGAARTAIHPSDSALLRDRRAHVSGYLGGRFRYLDDPAGLARTEALLLESISGEVAADRELVEGDRVNLGGGIALHVLHTPGHSPGSVTYVLDGLAWAFAGDAVQVCGSSGSRFPLFVDPAAYRASLRRLLEEVKPARLYLGHRFLHSSGSLLNPQIEEEQARVALRTSLETEARLAEVAMQVQPSGPPAVADDFRPAATLLGYGDTNPAEWPTPLFTTLSGYLVPGIEP